MKLSTAQQKIVDHMGKGYTLVMLQRTNDEDLGTRDFGVSLTNGNSRHHAQTILPSTVHALLAKKMIAIHRQWNVNSDLIHIEYTLVKDAS